MMNSSRTSVASLLLTGSLSALLFGCGAEQGTGDRAQSGGTTASGGAGGVPGSTGGAGGTITTTTGGTTASGGATATGGNTGTGGATGSCNSPQQLCNNVCVTTDSDLRNCGSCGNSCGAQQACVSGQCTCATGKLCGTTCTDTQNDNANCGNCGTTCSARQFCNAGSCTTAATCPDDSAATGWATQGGTTTGGGTATAQTVTSASALNSAAGGTTARVIVVSGTISGDITIGDNKTIRGACGGTATIKGHIQIQGSKNVILRNLNIVGKNCSDSSDCSAGDDTITIDEGSNHIFIDHCDISDGSDGNVDITHASDYITIAWTKFHYSSGTRTGGHEFSNLIGHSASNGSEDTGHLRVTFSHDWWADNVDQRMPRVRFGHVHIFNSLYTATGDTYCIGVGADANILLENSVFVGVKNPIDTGNVDPTAASVLESNGNIFSNTTGGKAAIGSGVAFTPPYAYTLDDATGVQNRVKAGAGPI